MTDKLALYIGLVIGALLIVNFAFGLDVHIFLGRKLIELTHWLAFWR